MTHPKTAIIHYSAPPVIGGVEAVIQAHVEVMARLDYPVTVVAGRGEADALPESADLELLPISIPSTRKFLRRARPWMRATCRPTSINSRAGFNTN